MDGHYDLRDMDTVPLPPDVHPHLLPTSLVAPQRQACPASLTVVTKAPTKPGEVGLTFVCVRFKHDSAEQCHQFTYETLF